MSKDLVAAIRSELAKIDDIVTPDVRKLGKEYFKNIKGLSKKEIFELCQELLEPGTWEERTIAFQWAFRIKNRYEMEDFQIFENWLDRHVKGWASCDDLCTHAMGELVYQYPGLVPKVKDWTSSDNMWKRRAAAVVMVYCIKKENYLDSVFQIADALFHDDEDLVQKGYGWMLKVASQTFREEVYEYVMKNKATMPRTSLRYAIEKMPEDMRKKAMA